MQPIQSPKPIILLKLKPGDLVYYYAFDENRDKYLNKAVFVEWGKFGCIVLKANENGKDITTEKVVRDVFLI